MSRYDTPPGIEAEYEPGSRGYVLRNLLGINSKRAIDQAETVAFWAAQAKYLSRVTNQTIFTTGLIREMHRDWLGKIYEWAGEYRTVEMSKGGFTWPPAQLVTKNMAELEAQTLKPLTPCRSRDMEKVMHDLAQVQAEFLLVHPFREGNGRMGRWITNLMALQAGLPELDYGFRGRGKAKNSRDYLHGVVRGYGCDYEPLARFLAEALRRGVLRAGAGSLTPRAPSK